MGLSEDEFFAQSVISWRRRMKGFSKFHSGGGGDGADEYLTKAELADLEARYPDQSATPADAPKL